MTMDRHIEAETLESYALGQLPDADRRSADAHLDVCAACTAELRELNAVLSGIGGSVPPIAPSAGLRQRVLASVERETQERASIRSHRPPGATGVEHGVDGGGRDPVARRWRVCVPC